MSASELFVDYTSFSTSDYVIEIISFIIGSIFCYFLARKANIKQPWFAFIPVLNLVLFFRLINKPATYILWHLLYAIPSLVLMISPDTFESLSEIFVIAFIFYAFLSLIWIIKLLNAFGRSGWGILLLMIPFVNIVYILHIAFSKDVKYVLEGNRYTKSTIAQ